MGIIMLLQGLKQSLEMFRVSCTNVNERQHSYKEQTTKIKQTLNQTLT